MRLPCDPVADPRLEAVPLLFHPSPAAQLPRFDSRHRRLPVVSRLGLLLPGDRVDNVHVCLGFLSPDDTVEAGARSGLLVQVRLALRPVSRRGSPHRALHGRPEEELVALFPLLVPGGRLVYRDRIFPRKVLTQHLQTREASTGPHGGREEEVAMVHAFQVADRKFSSRRLHGGPGCLLGVGVALLSSKSGHREGEPAQPIARVERGVRAMGVLRLSRLVAHTVVVRLTSIRLFNFMEHWVMSITVWAIPKLR